MSGQELGLVPLQCLGVWGAVLMGSPFPLQHDTTLVALQMALDVYNGEQAPYAACHIFELYQEDNG